MRMPKPKFSGGQLSREVIIGNSFTMQTVCSSTLMASRRSKSPNVGFRIVVRGSFWTDGARFISGHSDKDLLPSCESNLLGLRLVCDAQK